MTSARRPHPRPPKVHTGQGSVALGKAEFRARMEERFDDPAFDAVRPQIEAVIDVAWEGFAVVAHGDTAGVDTVRRGLTDWLLDMQLIQAGASASLGRYIGFYEPYATSHDALDRDKALHEEVRNAARSLINMVRAIRLGRYRAPDAGLSEPRPK